MTMKLTTQQLRTLINEASRPKPDEDTITADNIAFSLMELLMGGKIDRDIQHVIDLTGNGNGPYDGKFSIDFGENYDVTVTVKKTKRKATGHNWMPRSRNQGGSR